MSTLLLRLAAPMQSWGAGSRFSRRTTEPQPTKSGVLGLLAAALGRRRTDPLEDLLGLTFAVRLDQPGQVQRDFQTARTLDGAKSMPLSHRYYLADAAFLAAVQGDRELVAALDEALRRPVFPLCLGRRSCPPVGPITLGIRDGDVREVLRSEPWQASPLIRARGPAEVTLEALADAEIEDPVTFTCRDTPLSFDPEWRRYRTRLVTRFTVRLPNPDSRVVRESAQHSPIVTGRGTEGHDPMSALGEG
jgi:CRISPR system Cascade subunit CasD